jgi:hypothetical protein
MVAGEPVTTRIEFAVRQGLCEHRLDLCGGSRSRATAKASDLLIDAAGGGSIAALLDIREVGQLLGAAFVQFTMAGGRSPCFVSRTAWVRIVPHPQVADVTQINFANRYLAVVGSVEEVRAKLEGASAGPTATITARARRRRASK